MNLSPSTSSSASTNSDDASGSSGQETICWIHELDISRLEQGWFCLCGLQCTSKGKLTQHTKSLNSARNFTCKLCPSGRFPSANKLYRHMESCHQIVHRGWVGCGECGAVFKTRLEQSRHRATVHEDYEFRSLKHLGTTGQHTSSGGSGSSSFSFVCSCGKEFATKEYLSRHQRYTLKMFKCPLCKNTYGQWYNLKNHLATKHIGAFEQESFECGKCHLVFPNIEHVVAHYRAVHGQYRLPV